MTWFKVWASHLQSLLRHGRKILGFPKHVFFFCGLLCIGIGDAAWGVDASFFSQSLDWWPQERSLKLMVIQWLFNDILDISGQWIGYLMNLMVIQWLSNGGCAQGYGFGVQLGSVSDLTCGVYFWWATAWPQFHRVWRCCVRKIQWRMHKL